MNNIREKIMLFEKLGFHLHPLMSVIIPKQKLTFLGFSLDSISTVSPTEEKTAKTLRVCKKLKDKYQPLISEVAEAIDIHVSNFQGAQFGPLHYRS